MSSEIFAIDIPASPVVQHQPSTSVAERKTELLAIPPFQSPAPMVFDVDLSSPSDAAMLARPARTASTLAALKDLESKTPTELLVRIFFISYFSILIPNRMNIK